MPYIIHTTAATTDAKPVSVTAHTAVATLDEAREAIVRGPARGSCHPDCGLRVSDVRAQLDQFTAAGGTIGPLPDGTVIEVRRVSWSDLACSADWTERGAPSAYMRDILAAFNEEQA